MTSFFSQLGLTLKLNLRSPRALVYGYLVPVIFLFAFGAIFRGGQPRLLGQMGQLLTVGVLGGACFGMPTALVAERERGVWRRYRLLPVSSVGLVAAVMVARLLIIASAAVIQIGLARAVYGTPLPPSPVRLVGVLVVVCFAFEGIGLVVVALADSVPAVQALGQAVFLPMIMIGGVGVPLTVLPVWARTVAGFFPGRYSVELIQSCFEDTGWSWFAVVALLLIGVAACVAGGRMFRWDGGPAAGRSWRWVAVALLTWGAVGGAAMTIDRPVKIATVTSAPASRPVADHGPWDDITDEQIRSIKYDGLPADTDNITPLKPTAIPPGDADEQQQMREFVEALQKWPQGRTGPVGQRVVSLLSAAVVADILQHPLEGYIARAAFDRIETDVEKDRLIHICAWIILNDDAGEVLLKVPQLGIEGSLGDPFAARNRCVMYAQKLLGRLTGRFVDGDEVTSYR